MSAKGSHRAHSKWKKFLLHQPAKPEAKKTAPEFPGAAFTCQLVFIPGFQVIYPL